MIELYLGGEEHIFVTRLVQNNGGFFLEIRSHCSVGAMPSFLAFSKKRRLALAIAESGEKLTSLRITDEGVLEVISEVACPGGPAYVAFDSGETHALTASYGSGETRLYSLSDEGHLLPLSAWSTGKYTHCAISEPAGSIIFSPSKGTDQIARTRYGRGNLIEPLEPIAAPQGSGPRHLAYSPDKTRAYLACENDCSLIVYDVQGEDLRQLCHLPTLPHGRSSEDSGADVHVSANGAHIYMSTRGRDTISCFRRTEAGATFVSADEAHCAVPRNFCLLDPDWLIVAGQESLTLSVFRRDLTSGSLQFLATVETPERPFWVGSPVSY